MKPQVLIQASAVLDQVAVVVIDRLATLKREVRADLRREVFADLVHEPVHPDAARHHAVIVHGARRPTDAEGLPPRADLFQQPPAGGRREDRQQQHPRGEDRRRLTH